MKVVLILIAILPWTDAFGDDDSCNRIGRKCLTQAHCNPETGQCECPNGTYGDGSFECVANDEYLCRIDSDPKVRTWDGASGDASLPCWYRVMAVTMILEPEYSWLVVNLFARNRMRSDGLFYVSEIRMVMSKYSISGATDDPVLESQTRFSLTVDAIWAAGGGNPWSYPPMVSWKGVVLLFTWNPQDNFAVITMANYGCRIKFRAFDPEALPQVKAD
nr:hypothetical protein BaRGS_029850 [Batillaria attramentaria]